MFSTLPKPNFSFSVKFILSSANAFNLVQSKILSCGKELIMSIILYDTILSLNDPEEGMVLKHKEIGENAGNWYFTFSDNVFYLFTFHFPYLSQICFDVCKCFGFG